MPDASWRRLIDALRQHGPRMTRGQLADVLGISGQAVDTLAFTATDFCPTLYQGTAKPDPESGRKVKYYGLRDWTPNGA